MQTIKQMTLTIIICLTVVTGVSMVSAWTGPTQSPTGGNMDAPINVGTSDQTFGGTKTIKPYSGGYLHFASNTAGLSIGSGGSISANGVFSANSSSYFSGNTYFASTNGIWNSSGNVGIGTTAPSEKLDVSGNANISGTTKISGLLNLNGFYFDNNNDGWMRLRTGDEGSYRDFAAGSLYSGGTLSVGALRNCDTIDTDGVGNFRCGADATGSDNLGNHIATTNLNMNGYYITGGSSGFTPRLYDGDNSISFTWTGTKPQLKVDATTFDIVTKNSAQIYSCPSKVSSCGGGANVGCVGQLSTLSTCTVVDCPAANGTYNCSSIGYLVN